jgi:polyisoprenoid-binding protein YceI
MTDLMVRRARAALRAVSVTTLLAASLEIFLATFLAAPAFAAATAPVKYTLDSAASLLRFSFVQAGANSSGRFGKFNADVTFGADNLPASKIDVSVDIASLDTGDQERDDTLKTADLFDVAKYPKARFVSSKIQFVGAGRYEAIGKLTIRNVTKEIKLPLTFQVKDEKVRQVGFLAGRTTLKRLEYGVGQGEWKSTEWVNDEVQVSFSLKLIPAT